MFLTFSSPGEVLFDFGIFSIKWYGFLIGISLLIGLNISRKLALINKINPNLVNDFLPIFIIISLIGARIYYVIFQWSNYSGNNFYSKYLIFNYEFTIPRFIEIWNGGIAIHGALLAGSIYTIHFCKKNKIFIKKFFDILIPSVILGQAIGRWGNFFNNEAFGNPTDLPWKLFIPFQKRPLEYLNFEFFHPTFLYESIWNFIIFLILISLINLANKKRIDLIPGYITFLYLILYSFGRFYIESLRTDPLCIGALAPSCEGGIRVAQFISILLFSSGIFGILFISRNSKKKSLLQKRK
tara:strand:+ start:6013 stop:6903 length:891 start_codon:yes stop_codon:yes gene_type:complete